MDSKLRKMGILASMAVILLGIALLHNACYHSVQICFRRSI